MKLIEYFYNYCKENSLDPQALALKNDLSIETLNRLNKGNKPGKKTINALARAMNIEAAVLTEMTDDGNEKIYTDHLGRRFISKTALCKANKINYATLHTCMKYRSYSIAEACRHLTEKYTKYPFNLFKKIKYEWDESKDDAEALGYAEKILSELTENERNVIRLRYEQGKTLIETGKICKKSHEWVRTTENTAIDRLRSKPVKETTSYACYDNNGNGYKTLKELCKAYQIPCKKMYYLRHKGYAISDAFRILTEEKNECKDIKDLEYPFNLFYDAGCDISVMNTDTKESSIEIMASILEKLRESEREILLLYYSDGLSYNDIAKLRKMKYQSVIANKIGALKKVKCYVNIYEEHAKKDNETIDLPLTPSDMSDERKNDAMSEYDNKPRGTEELIPDNVYKPLFIYPSLEYMRYLLWNRQKLQGLRSISELEENTSETLLNAVVELDRKMDAVTTYGKKLNILDLEILGIDMPFKTPILAQEYIPDRHLANIAKDIISFSEKYHLKQAFDELLKEPSKKPSVEQPTYEELRVEPMEIPDSDDNKDNSSTLNGPDRTEQSEVIDKTTDVITDTYKDKDASDDTSGPIADDNDKKDTAKTFKNLLIEKGITQAELAKRLNVHPALICRIAKGQKKASDDIVKKLAKELKISRKDLQTVLDNTYNSGNTVPGASLSTRLSALLEEKVTGKGMSIKEFSKKTGVTRTWIILMKNSGKIPPADILEKVADGLGVTAEYLLGKE